MVFIWIWWDSNRWDKSMNKSIYKITENHLVAVSKMKIDHIYIVLMNEIYCYSIRCYHESEIWYLCELSEGGSSAQPFLKRTSNKLQEQKGLELKLKGCNACFF